MSEAVVDASVVLRWAFEDEADRDGAAKVAAALVDGNLRVVAPPHFLLEVAAALAVAYRGGRITRSTVDDVMAALVAVSIDEADPHGFAVASLGLALATGTRVPDCAYIETGRRTGALLISADSTQLEAAEAMGIAAIALRELPPL